MITFFFSSRSRHTRSKRDWSSDVCSSDLLHREADPVPSLEARITPEIERSTAQPAAADHATVPTVVARSEERRVGKDSDSGSRPKATMQARRLWLNWGCSVCSRLALW